MAQIVGKDEHSSMEDVKEFHEHVERSESLTELHDPDAGKSPEERARIVSCHFTLEVIKTDSITGQSLDAQGRSVVDSMAMSFVSAVVP